MKKLSLALALLLFNQLAHAMLVLGGALYEDGSTFEFIIDDSREGFYGHNYRLMTFTHGTYRYSSQYGGGVSLIESPTDEGDVFGDSVEDTWKAYATDFPADDYYFSPEYFKSYGGNIDTWRPANSGTYSSNAVRSYLTVNVPEPDTLPLFLAGIVGLLIYRKQPIS